MQPATDQMVAKKTAKVPTILLAAANIGEDIKSRVIDALEEGLSHLNIKLINDEKGFLNLEKSHMVVIFDKDEDLLKKAWSMGVVPITTAFDSSIIDYNPNTESGNSFVYESLNHWEIFAAIVRACETYKFPYDWKFIVRSCTKSA